MKNLIAVLASLLLSGFASYGQGQLTFSNFSTADGLNAKVVIPGTTTGATSPPYYAQLLRVNVGLETPVGSPVSFRPQAVAAGYVIPTVMTIDDVPIGGSASFRMVVLAGSTYSEKVVVGKSSVVTIALGGGTVSPPPLIGLTGIDGEGYIQMVGVVPEPSTVILGLLGFMALLSRGPKRRIR